MAKVNKVLMLIENCSVPTDNRVWAEATALRDVGYQVSIISPKGFTKDVESSLCIDSIHIYRYRLPAGPSGSAAYILEYTISLWMTFWLTLRVWFRHGFDVIHAANPPDFFFMIGLFYRLFGKKFVFDQHDLSPEMFHVKFAGRMKLLSWVLRFSEWCSYKAANVVITTNMSQKRFAIQRGRCSAENVFVVRNGPDPRRIRRVDAEPELKRGRQFLLAYLGEMEAQDGIDFALYALHDLVHKRGRDDVSLVLMGDGGHLPALRNLTHTLKLDEYTHFTGWVQVNDLVRYLSVADIGLTPDPQNGLNEYCTMVKTMEYMAAGLPVVAFDLVETRLSAQDAALYATPNDVEEFASMIEKLLDDDVLRLAIGTMGQRRIEETLSWEYDKLMLLQAYQRLAKIPIDMEDVDGKNTRDLASTNKTG